MCGIPGLVNLRSARLYYRGASSALAAVLALTVVTPALAADVGQAPDGMGISKASQNPIIIRGQLDLGRVYARQALQRLQTAASEEEPANLDRLIYDSYWHIRIGTEGVNLKRQVAKNARFINPILEMAAEQLEAALGQIRVAHQLAVLVSTGRRDVIPRLITHLEATVSIVEHVIESI